MRPYRISILNGLNHLILGGILIYAGIVKLRGIDVFVRSLADAEFLGFTTGLSLLSWSLAFLELLLGIALCFYSSFWLYALALLLMLFYTSLLWHLVYVQESIACTCKSLFPFLSWEVHFYASLVYIVLVIFNIYNFFLLRSKQGVDRKPGKTE
jgi:hypothetical protein